MVGRRNLSFWDSVTFRGRAVKLKGVYAKHFKQTHSFLKVHDNMDDLTLKTPSFAWTGFTQHTSVHKTFLCVMSDIHQELSGEFFEEFLIEETQSGKKGWKVFKQWGFAICVLIVILDITDLGDWWFHPPTSQTSIKFQLKFVRPGNSEPLDHGHFVGAKTSDLMCCNWGRMDVQLNISWKFKGTLPMPRFPRKQGLSKGWLRENDG